MSQTDTAPSNAPELSVSELSFALKRTVEDAYGYVRVRGEVSGFRGPHSSGHCYFCLKDESARLDAVVWKTTYGRLRFKPQEGLEVVATGRITTFPGKSSYQIVIDALEPAGVGALMALLEERKRKLQAEGLFEAARKKPLPYLPRVVGVVTSPTGAVIRDILHRLNDRFPRHVLVWPVRVQGETSAAEVAAAIRGFNALPRSGGPVPRPDVLIVARGGGSLEDLWGFNEEVVVRAAAESEIPLIAAVGHETDTTLIDHAADRRAPTPTAAAEMAVPVRAELLAQVGTLSARLVGGLGRLVERRRSDLRGAARALPQPEALLAQAQQRFDNAAQRLAPALRAEIREKRVDFSHAAARLTPGILRTSLARAAERLDGLGGRSTRALAATVRGWRVRFAPAEARMAPALVLRRLDDAKRRFMQAGSLLEAYSYKGTLARGFVLVTDGTGHPVRSAGALPDGTSVTLEFTDGKRDATLGAGSAPTPPTETPARSTPKRKPPGSQGDLFG